MSQVPDGVIQPKAMNPGRVQRTQGFTLVELMITVAIMAIFLGIAAPSFENITLRSYLRSYTSAFTSSTVLARSEAIKRNAMVKMCVSTDGAICAAGGWEQGWIVFADANDNGTVDGNEVVLQQQAAAGPRFLMTEAGAISQLRFPASGIGVQPVVVRVCRNNPPGPEERVISLTASGRTNVTKTTAAACP